MSFDADLMAAGKLVGINDEIPPDPLSLTTIEIMSRILLEVARRQVPADPAPVVADPAPPEPVDTSNG